MHLDCPPHTLSWLVPLAVHTERDKQLRGDVDCMTHSLGTSRFGHPLQSLLQSKDTLHS